MSQDKRPDVMMHPTIFVHCIELQEYARQKLRDSLLIVESNPTQVKENIEGVLSVLGATAVVFEDTQYRYEQKQLNGVNQYAK